MQPIPVERLEQAMAAYQAGEPVKVFTWRYGMSEQTFRVWRRRSGVAPRCGCGLNLDREQIRSLHADGLTDRGIAEQLGIGRESVRKVRLKLGLGVNNLAHFEPGNRRRKPSIDTEAMRRIYEPGMSDRVLGAKMGVSRSWAGEWRRRLGLSAVALMLLSGAAHANGWQSHPVEKPDPFAAMRNIEHGEPGFGCCSGEDCAFTDECTVDTGAPGVVGPDQKCHAITEAASQVRGCPSGQTSACFIGTRENPKMLCACQGGV